ncbi:MAG: hypothetical protein AB1489_41920, partial [Acidobacteriota bacterium]
MFPLHIQKYGDGNFRVIRKWGYSVIATRQLGLEAIGMFVQGLSLQEVKQALAHSNDCNKEKVDLMPLLETLYKANLIKSIDGKPVGKNEVTISTFLNFIIKFKLFSRLINFSNQHLSIPLLRKILFVIDFLRQKAPTREKVHNASINMRLVLSGQSTREIKQYRKEYYHHLIKNIVDLESLRPKAPMEIDRWLSSNTSCEGLIYLDQALSEKKGILLCGYHFSSIRLIPLILIKHGYSLTTMGAINLHLGSRVLSQKMAALKECFNNYGQINFVPNIDLKTINKLIDRLKQG